MASGVCVCVCVCARPYRLSSRHVAWRRECVCMWMCVWALSAWGHPRLGLIKAAATGSPWLGWQTYRVSTQSAPPHLPSSPWVAHHATKTNAARASMKIRPALFWTRNCFDVLFVFLEKIYLLAVYFFFYLRGLWFLTWRHLHWNIHDKFSMK